MDSFKIQIAGLVTQVLPLYETTAVYCRSYLTEEAAAFRIAITEEDLAFEQHMLDDEAREEGIEQAVQLLCHNNESICFAALTAAGKHGHHAYAKCNAQDKRKNRFAVV